MGIIGGAEIKSQMSRVELNGLEVEVVTGLEHVHRFGHQQLGHETRRAVGTSGHERVEMPVHVEIGKHDLRKTKKK